MMRRLTLLPLAVFLLLSCATVYAANEAECDALGANCVCSDPMNSNSWTQVATWWWKNNSMNPATDKTCDNEGQANAVYATDNPSGNLTFVNAAADSTMFTALPSGHTVSYVPKTVTGGSSGSFGTKFLEGTDSFQRQGMRFYRYYSPDFRFTDAIDPNCNSGKVVQLGFNGDFTGGPIWSEGGRSTYDFAVSTGWSADVACCSAGGAPGFSGTLPTLDSLLGSWIRYEFYMDNNSTSGTTAIQLYMKNITAGTPEVRIADTTGSALFTGVHPSTVMAYFTTNNFRGANAGTPPGTCAGYFAHSHFLAAAWATSTGQRIGAATEVEGSGAQTYSGSLSGVFRMQGVGVWR